MRYTAIFSAKSFAALVRPNDSTRFKFDLKNDLDKIIKDAVAEAYSNKPGLAPFNSITVNGKKYVSYTRYTDHLILRAIVRYLTRRYRIKVPTRDAIVKGVIEGLMDATPMYIVRRDIRSFYENIRAVQLRNELMQDINIPRNVKLYIEKFFDQHSGPDSGLPRGVGLSAILAELYMQGFDREVHRIHGVYRYYRYCDDILIFLTEKPQEFDSQLSYLLPPGMTFNTTKCRDHNLADPQSPVPEIEYLGYCFRPSKDARSKTSRIIEVGISERKIRKLQAKIFASFRQYEKDSNFNMLLDRIRYLSSNYMVYRNNNLRKSSTHVRSGLFYNYKLCGIYKIKNGTECTIQPPPLAELKAVDGFYHSLLKGANSKFARLLNPLQRDKLKQISFYKGYALRMLVRFHPLKISDLKKVWKHV